MYHVGHIQMAREKLNLVKNLTSHRVYSIDTSYFMVLVTPRVSCVSHSHLNQLRL